MKLDIHGQKHDQIGRYTFKENGTSAVVLDKKPVDPRFAGYVERAEKFIILHGHIPTHRKELPDEGALYRWMARTRAAQRAGTLTQEQQDLLNELPMEILPPTPSQEFRAKFKQFEAYMKEHSAVPFVDDGPEEAALSTWLRNIHKQISHDESYVEKIKPFLKDLRPDIASVISGETKIPSSIEVRRERVRQQRIGQVLTFMNSAGKIPSRYSEDQEEVDVFTSLKLLVDTYRDDPRKLDELSSHPLFSRYEHGVFHDRRVDNGAEQRAQSVALINDAVEKHGDNALEFLAENHPEQHRQIMYIVGNLRDGAEVFSYSERDEAFDKLLGPGWKEPDFSPRRVSDQAFNERNQATEDLREFMASSGGRRPSRYHESEARLQHIIRSRQLAARSNKGLDPKVMDEMNEIFGVGWHVTRQLVGAPKRKQKKK